ncbi:hypothetical protein ACFQ36_12800 [Arthrobacter sp. GCM10027362]|uniref:hypothetical protein n=1 Tax=Arthrobacter sp. GCM10027362 TaxID=3273379 RepID=UPI00362CF4FC
MRAWKTAQERLRKWTADGIWEKIMAEAAAKDDAVGKEWIPSTDSVIRARQHAAGARNKGLQPVGALAGDGEGIGRSRGGLGSRIRWAVDGRGLSMSLVFTPGTVKAAPAAGLRCEAYEHRSVVERCFNRLRQFRDLATQYAQRCLLPDRTAHRRRNPVAAVIHRTGPGTAGGSDLRASRRQREGRRARTGM